MKYYLSFILFLTLTTKVICQKQGNFSVSAGYGFYEAIHAGILYKIDSTKFIAAHIGGSIINQKYFTATIEYNWFLKRKKTTLKIFPYFLSFRGLYFYLEDDFYIWKSITFCPSFGRHWQLSDRFKFSADAGVAINNVIYSKRKTFNEVGWPRALMPNFRLQIHYKL